MGRVLVPGIADYNQIVVQTRVGTPIRNSQDYEVSPESLERQGNLSSGHPMAQSRAKARAFYNCHGLVFASRRTWIYHLPDLTTILREDGYKEIPRTAVLPGDVILYRNVDGDVEHSGMVVSEPDLAGAMAMMASAPAAAAARANSST